MYALENRSPASCAWVQPAAVRAVRTRAPIPEATLAGGRPTDRLDVVMGGSVLPQAPVSRRQQPAGVDPQPAGEVEQCRQRRQRLARFDLRDVGPGQWPAELRLAHPTGDPGGTDAPAEVGRELSIAPG